MRRVRSVLRLIRWGNALVAAAGVVLGAWWAGGDPWSRSVVLAALAAVALAAFANAFNDYHDRDIDVVAHPHRPLPRGELQPRTALGIATAAASLALALSLLARPALAFLSAAVLLGMHQYSHWIKRYGLPGNVVVAVLGSLPFLYGAWMVGHPARAVPLLAFAVPLHAAREIAKDLDDAEGDRGHRHTLALAANGTVAHGALLVSLALFAGVLAGVTRAAPRFGLVMIPTLVLCAVATTRALTGQRGGPQLFKGAMLCAMAALLTVRGE